MYNISSSLRIRRCFKCPEDTEFVCCNCRRNLCLPCKDKHADDIDTKDHHVVVYREISNRFSKQEMCVRHPKMVFGKYCETCKVPICNMCQDHGKHEVIDIKIAYTIKRELHLEPIRIIRSETLFYRRVLLEDVQSDRITCLSHFSNNRSEVIRKAVELKSLIDCVINEKLCMYKNLLMFRLQKQTSKKINDLVRIQNYEYKYEESASWPTTFIIIQKKLKLSRLENRRCLTNHVQLSMNESFGKIDVIKILTEIQPTNRVQRQVRNERIYTFSSNLNDNPLSFYRIPIVRKCFHISCVTPDLIWVSDVGNDLILTNTAGSILHHINDSCPGAGGKHTVNCENELMYIDHYANVKKVSNDLKSNTTLIQTAKDSMWIPQCVYYSPTSGDLLVGMFSKDDGQIPSKVIRYNQSGQLTQTIQSDNAGHSMFRIPRYITENNNGDVVVSDWLHGVVVTDRGGKHRFSFIRQSPGKIFMSQGICTDALSNILLCAVDNNAVMMLDKDGQFLGNILNIAPKRFLPASLCYDLKTHRVWVGSVTNIVIVNKYIDRQDIQTGRFA